MSIMFDNNFPCTGCSLCCKNIRKIHGNALSYPKESIIFRAAAAFPYSWDSSGSCVMLKDDLCSVYSSRPLLCNVKEISQQIALELDTNLLTVYALNASACNALITNYGLDARFMIDTNQFE